MTSGEAAPVRLPEALSERFRVLGTIGRGAMGAVLEAEDRILGRRVALKLLSLPGNDRELRRFQREAVAMARLRHPNVVQVFDSGVEEGVPYLVMEVLEGRDLDSAPPDDPMAVLLPIADAIEACHREGILHRDIKPANMFLTREGRPVLLDFGLARDTARTQLTSTGMVPGTLAFLSPERLRGDDSGWPSDWWSFGVSLFRIVERRLPFDFDALSAGARGDAMDLPRFHRIHPGSGIARVIAACLDPDPARRPASRADLESILESEPEPEPGPWGGPDDEAGPGSDPAMDSRLAGLDRGTRTFLAVLLAVGLGSLTAARWLARGSPPRNPEGSRPTPADGTIGSRSEDESGTIPGELGPGYPSELRREAEANLGTWLDPQGRRSEPPGGTAPPGWRPYLDDDPFEWGAVLRRLTGPSRFARWAGQGGQVSSLPIPFLDELFAVDGWFLAQDLPRPLFPYLYVVPASDDVPVAGSRLSPVGTGSLPETVSGWLATALRARQRGLELQRRFEAQVTAAAKGGDPGTLPVGELRPFLPAIDSLRALIEVGSANPARRRAIRAWLREGSEEVHALCYALSRSLSEQPQLALAAAGMGIEAMEDLRSLFTGHLTGLDWEQATGRPPVSPPDLLVAGWFHLQTAVASRRGGRDAQAERERCLAGLDRAIASAPGSGTADAWIRMRAFDGHFELMQAFPGAVPFRSFYEAHTAELQALHSRWFHAGPWRRVMEDYLDARELAPASLDAARKLWAWLALQISRRPTLLEDPERADLWRRFTARFAP